jgi:hypothetical protein
VTEFLLHNELAGEVRVLLERLGWQVSTEKRFVAAGTTAYFDLFAVKEGRQIALEIETTARHALDNAQKARAIGVPVWFVVPRRRTKRQIVRKLDTCLDAGGESVKVLLLGEIESELALRATGQTTKDHS